MSTIPFWRNERSRSEFILNGTIATRTVSSQRQIVARGKRKNKKRIPARMPGLFRTFFAMGSLLIFVTSRLTRGYFEKAKSTDYAKKAPTASG
jgi:hypothetical protein